MITSYQIHILSPIGPSVRLYLTDQMTSFVGMGKSEVNALLSQAPSKLSFSPDRTINERIIKTLKGAGISANLLEVSTDGEKLVTFDTPTTTNKQQTKRPLYILLTILGALSLAAVTFWLGRLTPLEAKTQASQPTQLSSIASGGGSSPLQTPIEKPAQEANAPLSKQNESVVNMLPTPEQPKRQNITKRQTPVKPEPIYDLAQTPEESGAFNYIPISEWIGRGVVFLETDDSLQHYGYQSVHREQGGLGSTPYSELVGKTGIVVSVTEDFIIHEVEIKLDNGGTYYAEAYNESVNGLALLRDILDAEQHYERKTLWVKQQSYEDSKIARFSRVKVIDVKASQVSYVPVEFIVVDSSGIQDSYYVNMSGTNTGDILFDNDRFDEIFYTRDPRQTHNWPESVWTALQENKVLIGMTSEQALLGWGKPDDINTTTNTYGSSEQWVYTDFDDIPRSYLYFDNGVLSSIQN